MRICPLASKTGPQRCRPLFGLQGKRRPGVGCDASSGASVSVPCNNFIYQFLATTNVLASRKARNLHVAVIKNIRLHPLPDERKGHHDRILTVPPQRVMDVDIFQLSQEVIKWVRSTHARNSAAADGF